MKKLDKIKNIEEANKRLLRENISESNRTGDLNNSEDASNFKQEFTSLLNKYLGMSFTNDAGTSNDNRVWMGKNLKTIMDQTFPPSSLRMGSHGKEYYTNRPEEMTSYLQSIGITDFELKSVK